MTPIMLASVLLVFAVLSASTARTMIRADRPAPTDTNPHGRVGDDIVSHLRAARAKSGDDYTGRHRLGAVPAPATPATVDA